MTTITLPRATVEQALETIESLTRDRLFTAEWAGKHGATIAALRAALAQQDEPVAVAERERIAAQWDGCVTHQLDTFGPVDIGASIRAGELVGPAQRAEPVEPVAWVKEDVCDGQYIDGRPRKIWWECNKGVGTAFYTTPPQRPAEPVQEPVAWVSPNALAWELYQSEKVLKLTRTRQEEYGFTEPLFTAPPQRKPLTEEEIVDAVREADLDWQAGWTLDEHEPNRFTTLARAVERAHGIKE